MPDLRQNDLPFQRQQTYVPQQMSQVESAQRTQIKPATVTETATQTTLTDYVEHGANDPNVAPQLEQGASLNSPDNYNNLNQTRVNMIFPPAPAGMPLGNQAYMYPNGIIGGIPHAPVGATPGQFMNMIYDNGLMGGMVEPWVYFGNAPGPIQSVVGSEVTNAQIAEGTKWGTADVPKVQSNSFAAKNIDMGNSVMSIGVKSDGTLDVTTAPGKNEIFPLVSDNTSSNSVVKKVVNRTSGSVYRAMM